MRILFVSPEYPPLAAPGGIGTYLATTAPVLAEMGHEVHVLACGRGYRNRTILERGVLVHLRPLLPVAAPLLPLAPRAALRASLEFSVRQWAPRLEVGFDVVETTDWAAHGSHLARSIASRRVVHLHTSIAVASQWERAGNSVDLRLSTLLEQRSIAHADRAVAPSNRIVTATRRAGVRVPPTAIVPLGISTRNLPASPIPSGDPEILVVGRLQSRKRPDLVLDAVDLLGPVSSRCTVVYAGRQTDDRRGRALRASLETQAQRSKATVAFVGQLDRVDLDERYRKARVVVVASDFESYSMVAVEALGRARPVVLTNGVGAGEVLGPVVDTIPTGSAGALAAALDPLLNDQHQATERGAVARAYVEAELDPFALAERRLEIYRSL